VCGGCIAIYRREKSGRKCERENSMIEEEGKYSKARIILGRQSSDI
jgi:hypothetical protein